MPRTRSYSRRRTRRSQYGQNRYRNRSRARYGKIEKNFVDKTTAAFGDTGGGTPEDYANWAQVNATTLVFSSTRYASKEPRLIVWRQDSLNSLINANPSDTCLSFIPQGTSTSTRIGRRIFVKDIMFDLRLGAQMFADESGVGTNGLGAMSKDCFVTLIVFRHRSSQGNPPLPQDLYVTASGVGSTEMPTSLIRNKNATATYDVIKLIKRKISVDWEHQRGTTRVRGEGQVQVQKSVKVNKYVMYKPNSTLGTISEHMDGGIYVMGFVTTSQTDHELTVSGYARLNFIDI